MIRKPHRPTCFVEIAALVIVTSAVASSADLPPAVVIDNCALFDSTSVVMLDGRTILIRGERIEAVAAAGAALEVPADAVHIDGRGKYTIPGLIDAHVHVVHILDYAHVTCDEVLPLYLAAGVTSIRSTGDE